MLSCITQIRENISRVRTLGGLYCALNSLTTPLIDGSDILRSQIVLSVSALDHYIHAITRTGMLEVYSGKRPTTDAFLKFPVPADVLMASNSGGSGIALFEDEIREQHSFLSFQQPDKVADAIRLFSSCKLWKEVGTIIGSTPTDIKTRLKLIVDRRNKIAHEADLDPSFPGVRWPITSSDADSVTDYISELCEAIHAVVL